jgi:hypothetical protein
MELDRHPDGFQPGHVKALAGAALRVAPANGNPRYRLAWIFRDLVGRSPTASASAAFIPNEGIMAPAPHGPPATHHVT